MPKKHKFIKIYVPEEMNKFYKERNHQTPENWTKLYYYNSRTRDEVKRENVVHELVSCGQYQNNMFYKIGAMSRKDSVWDYYRILKKHPYQQIAVKTNKKLPKPSYGCIVTHFPKDKPCVISFQ